MKKYLLLLTTLLLASLVYAEENLLSKLSTDSWRFPEKEINQKEKGMVGMARLELATFRPPV